MQERIELIYNTASQTIVFDSPWGRPTSTPTVGTADKGGTALTAAATTYVTQSTVNTTIAASASAGATSITVASATGITAGKTYWLTNEYNQIPEQCRVQKTDSTTIYLVDPLKTDFDKTYLASNYGDFQSTEFTYSVQSTDYDTLREMNVATATFTAGGLPRSMRIVFDVVRVPLNAPGPLTAEAMYERLGRDLARQEPDEQRGEDYGPQRKAAWNIVRRRIYQHGIAAGQWRPSMVVDPSDLFEYGIATFTRVCHDQGIKVLRSDPQPTRSELLEAEETERSKALNAISWLDIEDDAARDVTETRPLELDFVR